MNSKNLEQPDRKAGPQDLEFERLLADLSARFVGIPADQVDSEIDYALRKILEFFQVDRAGLLRSLPHKSAYRITHAVYSKHVPSVPVGVELPMSLYPWVSEKLAKKHEVVSFSKLDDLPPEAYVDKQKYAEWGIRSGLDIPIITGGSAVHVIAINSVKNERVWPEDLIPRLRLIGEIFVNALERRDAERALHESEERLSLATASGEMGIWIMDTGSGSVWVTDKLRELFCFAPDEELTFGRFLEVIHSDDRELVREAIRGSIENREHLRVEYRIVHPDGKIRWIVARGRPYPGGAGLSERLMGVSNDVTQRKMTELHLSESRALLSALIDSTSDMIWSVDSERFGLLTFNRSLSDYFFSQRGIRIEAGMDPGVLLPTEEYAETWRRFYRRALEAGSFTTEYRVYSGTKTLLLNLNRLTSGGVVFGVSVFGKDITERKAMEARLQEQLGEIERLKLQLEDENIYLREELGRELGFGNIIGKSEALQYVLFRAGQVAPTDAAVLILGETGTGKGLIANAIHAQSSRRDKPMVTVNCAALPANLIESELFGREKGAFTGAHARQAGRFEVADGGTICLDEIGELPLELQSKLLRVLQDGEFERLGSAKTIKVDVRVIASTSRDLREEVRAGRFREDLFYRLNVFPVSIPPLRERVKDIPELVRFFVDKYSQRYGRRIETIPKAAMKALEDYRWPGNVRELEHVIERAVITTEGTVFRLADPLEPLRVAGAADEPLKDLAAMEREHILRVLRETGWRIEGPKGAARVLDLHPSTLRLRMKKLGIRRT
jgi:PAS domain S-box-containing protein